MRVRAQVPSTPTAGILWTESYTTATLDAVQPLYFLETEIMQLKQTQFRFSDETRSDLAKLRDYLAGSTGMPVTRTDAVRWAIRQSLRRFLKKSGDSSKLC